MYDQLKKYILFCHFISLRQPYFV